MRPQRRGFLNEVTELEADLPQEERLEPFSYLPGVGSRIGGLATGGQADDPNYVFHTDYVMVGQGVAYVRLRFVGLRAKHGTLLTRIHMVTNDVPPRLGLITSERTSFNRLMQHGELVIRFEAFGNARYAVYGTVLGETDAEAEGLEVVLQRPESGTHPRGIGMEARNSDQGQGAARQISKLVSIELPRMDAPVSQIATERQLVSASARTWLKSLEAEVPAHPLERWATVFTLQALRVYGAAGAGARGLGFGAAGSVIAPLLAKGDVEIVATSEDAATIDDKAGDPPGLTRVHADHSALGRSLLNFDFLWNHDGARLHGSASHWITGIEDTITALLPGGLAVFTVDYDPGVPMRRLDASGPIQIGRAEFERLALVLISRGHQVAQLKILGDYKPLTYNGHSVAGLIVRRATMAAG